jgi:alkyl hydroperoxide reductase subunit F
VPVAVFHRSFIANPLLGRQKMLDATIKTQLKAYLERLQQPIELVASLDDSDQGAGSALAARRHRQLSTRSACAGRHDARRPRSP